MSRVGFLSSAAVLLVLAVPATAATTVTTSTQLGATPGQSILCDFNTTGNCSNIISGRGKVLLNNTPGVGATINGTGFFAVPGEGGASPSNPAVAVFDLSGLNWRNLSFDWGTTDTYNSAIVTFVGGTFETFTSSIFNAPNNSTRRVSFSSSQEIASLSLRSEGIAFEIDNLAGSVPEPGTWMLMILGLGAVGFAMRRRQNANVRFQFA
jgi:hypothetical protein